LKNRKRVALVIGSGAIKCAASIGLLKVLREENVPIDLVVGCSGGAIYGMGVASNMSVEEIIGWSQKTWTKDLMQGYLVNLKASKEGTLAFDERSGLVDDSVVNERLRQMVGEKTFADYPIPFYVVGTEMATGEQITISEGSVFDALRASMALPMIFPPWKLNGTLIIDGAASNPLPVDVAIQQGGDIVIAMGFTIDYRARLKSLTAVQEHMTSVYMNNILKNAFAFHTLAHHSEIFLIMPEFDSSVSMFDIHKIPHIVERGEAATWEQMPHIKALLADLTD
jgi:NTE family protein